MRFIEALKKFAYETFKPRSREEYAELFARGGGGEAMCSYPWLYFRAFLLFVLIFCVLCVCYSLSFINLFTLAFAGGIFGDLTFIILLYELYPGRDMHVFTPVAALLLGGLISTGYTTLLYSAGVRAPFAEQAYTAFVEETGKALSTVLILLVLKKRSPMCCFIIGAAVGGGYSAFENMWYMYADGLAYGGAANLSNAIQTALWRSLGTPFSHAAWAGMFGWAVSGPKPYKKWQPYAVFAFNYVMHFFVNFPLIPMFAGWRGYPISAITGVLTIVLSAYIIIISRRAEAGATGLGTIKNSTYYAQNYGRIHINGEEYGVGGAEKFSLAANALAMAAIFCLSLTLLGPTCVYGGIARYKTYSFGSFGEVKLFAQNGLELAHDETRAMRDYGDLSQNYAYTYEDGRVTSVTQREEYGGYTYSYEYANVKYTHFYMDESGRYFVVSEGKQVFVEGENGQPPEEAYLWELDWVWVEIDGVPYYRRSLQTGQKYLPVDEHTAIVTAENVYYYFLLNPNVSGIGQAADGGFSARVREDVPVRLVESIVFTVIFGAAAAACGAGYIINKKKARS